MLRLNSITSLTYKSKISSTATYGSASANIANTITGSTFSATQVTTFPNTASYNIEITAIDRFGGKSVQVVTISSGQPLFFLDTLNSAVGINTFPEPLASGIDPANVSLDVGITHGRASLFSKPTVAGNNEVTFRLSPADDLTTGLHVFGRRDSLGLHSPLDNVTFLRYTNKNNTSTTVPAEPKGSLKLYAGTSIELFTNFLEMNVTDNDGDKITVFKADGRIAQYGVPLNIGGGGNVQITAGEMNVPISSYPDYSTGSETLALESNGDLIFNWSNDTATGYSTTNRVVRFNGGTFSPLRSGNVNLGSSTLKWGTIYTDAAVQAGSDSTLKENIKNINDIQYDIFKKDDSQFKPSDFVNFVKDMPVYEYEYKRLEEDEHGKKQIGIMADIILKEDKTGIANYFVYKNNDEETASLSVQSYASILHIALQEQMKKSEELESQVDRLSKRLEMLEK